MQRAAQLLAASILATGLMAGAASASEIIAGPICETDANPFLVKMNQSAQVEAAESRIAAGRPVIALDTPFDLIEAADAKVASAGLSEMQITVHAPRNHGGPQGFGVDFVDPGTMHDEADPRPVGDVAMGSVDGRRAGMRNVAGGAIRATSMQVPLKMASMGVDAAVKFAAPGARPKNTDGFNFFDTGVTPATGKPVEGSPSITSSATLAQRWG